MIAFGRKKYEKIMPYSTQYAIILEEALKEELSKITPNYWGKLIRSMPNRWKAVIANKGLRPNIQLQPSNSN